MAVSGSSDRWEKGILADSGSDEHVCPETWHDDADLDLSSQGRGGALRGVQGNLISDGGRRSLGLCFQTDEGSNFNATTSFVVSDRVQEPLLSIGKMVRAGGVVHLTSAGSYLLVGDRRIPIQMRGNRFYVALQRVVATVRHVAAVGDDSPPAAPDPGAGGGRASTGDPGMGSSSSGVAQPTTGPPMPHPGDEQMGDDRFLDEAPPLRAWSSQAELKARLVELGEPVYGDKQVLWTRLQQAEAKRRTALAAAAALEQRRRELGAEAEPVEPRAPTRPVEPKG